MRPRTTAAGDGGDDGDDEAGATVLPRGSAPAAAPPAAIFAAGVGAGAARACARAPIRRGEGSPCFGRARGGGGRGRVRGGRVWGGTALSCLSLARAAQSTPARAPGRGGRPTRREWGGRWGRGEAGGLAMMERRGEGDEGFPCLNQKNTPRPSVCARPCPLPRRNGLRCVGGGEDRARASSGGLRGLGVCACVFRREKERERAGRRESGASVVGRRRRTRSRALDRSTQEPRHPHPARARKCISLQEMPPGDAISNVVGARRDKTRRRFTRPWPPPPPRPAASAAARRSRPPRAPPAPSPCPPLPPPPESRRCASSPTSPPT